MSLKSVLCIFAHPDDELFVAGMLAHLIKNDVNVHLLCLTRGEQGAPGVPAISGEANLAEIRTSELIASARVLGAKSVSFLNYVDILGENGELSMPLHDPKKLKLDLKNELLKTKAQIVISHGSDGEYGHPAHKGLHNCVLEAVSETKVEFYGFQADFDGHPYPNYANASDKADLIFYIGSYAESHVYPMFKCHTTQASWWAHIAAIELNRGVTLYETWNRGVFSHPFVSLKRFWPKMVNNSILEQWLKDHPNHEKAELKYANT